MSAVQFDKIQAKTVSADDKIAELCWECSWSANQEKTS
jgi:hypothetical protein